MKEVAQRRPDALLVLVRHGESAGNVGGVMSSKVDTHPLTPKGERQARIIASELAKLRVDRVVSSPLLRARQTAGIISDGLGLEVAIDERLRERGFGLIEGTVGGNYVWRFLKDKGIETYEEIAARVNSFIGELKPGVTIAVTHGDTMRAPILSILGLDEISGFGIRHYNTNIAMIYVRGSDRSIVTFGMPLLNEDVLQRVPDRFKTVQ